MSAITQVAPTQLPQVFGHTEPRLFTPPLRELTPETSYGFAVIEFARDVLKYPLDKWQEWLVIHIGELLEDGVTPRFEKALIIVGRQNGKTELLKVLTLYWLFVEKWSQILGVSTTFNQAQKVLRQVADLAESTPELNNRIERILKNTTETSIETKDRSTYYARAKGERAGRGDSLDRVVIDELRLHKDSTTYDAAIYAMSARPFSQAIFITNQGDEKAVVLDSLRSTALDYIEHGSGDETLGLFEWSAPEYADITDPENWAMANPNLGYRIPVRKVRSEALLAATGPAEEARFRTERLCIKVRTMDAAVDAAKWSKSVVPGDLRDYRDRLALTLDVSPDGLHATLVAAAIETDGHVRVEFLRAWEGANLLRQISNDLPDLLKRYRPVVFGWYPIGPASALSTLLKERKGTRGSIPLGIRVVELTGSDVFDACEGFAAEVSSLQLRHADDPLLNNHVTGAEKLHQGDRWRFQRNGRGHVDAAYAAAGAVLLARTMSRKSGPLKLITSTNAEED